MLRYQEDSEDLKVGVTELQERLGISEETRISIKKIAHQAMNENGHNFFLKKNCQGEEEVCIASPGQMERIVKLKKNVKMRCRQ